MSDRIIINNGFVVTMNDADDVLFGGAVVLEGDRIVDVGPARPRCSPGNAADGARVIDATGKAVLPGLVDLHYHTALGKGWSDHLPLWEYLETCWYPIIRALDYEAAYWAALASYSESIKCGVTTVNDMYRQLIALADAAEEIGIRAVLSNDIADAEHDLDTLDDNKDALPGQARRRQTGAIEVYVGIEWLPLASEELLRDARLLADELGHRFHIHLNESLTEVENSKQRFGRRPTEVAYDAGILGRNCIAAHCVWLSDTRDRPDAGDRHPDLAQPVVEREARQRDRAAAGDAGGRDQRRARPRRRRVQQQQGPVRGDELRLADPPGQPGRTRACSRPGRGADGDPERRGRARATRRGSWPAGRKADVILVNLKSQMFTPLMPENTDAPFLAPGLRRQRELRRHHDYRRQDRDGESTAHHRGRAEGTTRSQRRVPADTRPDGRPATGMTGLLDP